jgi:GT2 family glycosyltransferase
VTIIIPTRNRPDLLNVSLRGVLSETSYKNIEVIIVDHENDHPGVLEIFRRYIQDARVTVLPYSGVFDHSNMNNRASYIARGDILLFLNDDIEVIEPDWLTHMVAQFAQKDRGVVGARLLYPDRRIQHAGVILGFGGVAGHGAVGLGAEDAGYYGRLKLSCEVSALTGACMAMSRELFEEVGGFSARHLQRTFNDVDLCLKARTKGKVNIYTPLATLIHHESATDGGDVKLKQYKRLQGEVGYMLETWGLMRSDPYYNVNLALEGESFSLAFPPRRVAPWQASGIS